MTRRTLLLDLDGTLVDSVPDLLASCNRVMADRGLAPLTAPEITAMIGDGAPALVRRAMTARDQAATEQDVAAFLAAFLDDYTAHPAVGTKPYPGVPEALDRLAGGGWRLAVCTNKPATPARALLEQLGLLRHFAAVGGGDSYPVRKPDPAHLLATLADAAGSPGAAIMVGDHRNDVAAATAARLPCIFAAWGYGPAAMAEGAAATATRAADLPRLADSLLPA